MEEMQDSHRHTAGPSVGIIGAGLGGICLALALKRKGFTNFTIYDREDGVGGTWYQNRYPGCRCDVPAVLYSHSKHPKRDWNESHPPRSEILKYWENLLQSQGLNAHILLGHNFIRAKYESQGYTITFLHAGGEKVVHHDILVSAIGGFSSPYYPSWPGMQEFGRRIVHTARWSWDLTIEELKGKRVAVVGNGCSGVQVVTALAEDPTIQVYSISRTAQWVIANPGHRPQLSQPYTGIRRFLLSIPLVLWLYRFWIYLDMEVDWLIYPKKAEWIRRPNEKKFSKWMKDNAPRTVQDVIVPRYRQLPFILTAIRRLEEWRLIRDGGYMEALNKPNVTPIWDQLSSVKGKELRLEGGGSINVDYVVLATGFNTNYTLDIDGREGFTLRNGQRSEMAQYHGAALHGFPNHFTMLGNNVSLAHVGLLFGLEIQAEYIANLITSMARARIPTLEVKQEACARHTAFVDETSERLVWADTRSYWRAKGGTGRNFGLWPLPGAALWADNVYPDFADFHGAESLVSKRWWKRLERWIAVHLSAVLMAMILGVIGLGHRLLDPPDAEARPRTRSGSIVEPKAWQSSESSGTSSARGNRDTSY